MVLWIFGYSSLLWKAGFDYDERVVGFVKGYRRAFHIGCFEHRGTYDLPARVPTLEKDEDAVCWGVAYCIKGLEAKERVLSYLTARESEYDLVGTLDFFTEGSPDKPYATETVAFMSTATNKFYLGAAPLEAMAKQIARAKGPNGPNCDYLFRLVEALRDIGHEDAEVVELAAAVKKVLCEFQVHPATSGSGNAAWSVNRSLSSNLRVRLNRNSLSSKFHSPHLAGSPTHLSTGLSVSGLSLLSLSAPCSPRLVKSQAM